MEFLRTRLSNGAREISGGANDDENMKRLPHTSLPMPRGFRVAAVALCVIVTNFTVVSACNVPVFRYALERWHPDPYRVTLFHRGQLSEAQAALLRPFGEGAVSVNVSLRMVDADDLQDEADRKLFADQAAPQLPRLTVQYPQSLRIDKTIWAGPLELDATTRLLTSPLRTELVRRLTAGQTAVWLMLECGRPAKDDAVAKQLEDELKNVAETLDLPELTSAPEDNLLSNAPLQIAFSVLRVPRNVAAEQLLVEQLLNSEADLREFSEPMVFPVFGRGRALLPLIGAGITTNNIHESAAFLVGACSCEVKELNPGFDLLLAVDWNDVLFQGAAPPLAILAARSAVASDKPELVAIPVGVAAAATSTTAIAAPEESTLEFHYQAVGLMQLLPLGLALAAIVGVSAVTIVRLLRRRAP